ncbi:[protein release factor]-glutamine N5-methyltransferase [Abditibacterium utsteinense]|uniref:Release factor glutamine methyltransferase n=1 Tax=Abditibacterium utsteinense TaxID=1960156 RepID=A0A2S8SQS9_9BACT|nr:peptide chain release factor N(5)-glutamine methyltransferase [Abditibacterium utsteinense]PQV63157.1 [protein release factor]-glutamine N5-methyltransferase [Abditibacterium utsteinense]
MTHQKFLEMATQFLLQRTSLERVEARTQARLLLDAATGTRYSHLIAPEAILEAPKLQKLQLWLSDAARGRPIPYILGRAPFFGLQWQVDEHVLIPRPETELLVETVLQKMKSQSESPAPRIAEPRIADLGTGSGIIAVSLQKNRPDATVYALDISAGALEIAARNAHEHGAAVHFLQGQGDWLCPLHPFAPFDAIVSNPPYIAAGEIEGLEIGVRDFEPRLALDGGADGLNPFREIAVGAAPLLTKNGFVALELGAGQFASIRAIFETNGWQVEAPRRDLAGIERVMVAQMEV